MFEFLPQLIQGGLSLFSGLLGGSAASKAAKAQQEAVQKAISTINDQTGIANPLITNAATAAGNQALTQAGTSAGQVDEAARNASQRAIETAATYVRFAAHHGVAMCPELD